MNTNKQDHAPQDIDLTILQKGVSSFIEGIEYKIFKVIRFVFKNIVLLIFLIVFGAIIGYLIDSMKYRTYRHEVIIIPNLEGKSYLYKAIENIKYIDKDSSIIKANIEPVIDVNQFISGGKNLEVAKYLAENNIQIDKYKKDGQTENLYKYHRISIYTNKPDNDGKVISGFIDELSNKKFFEQNLKVNQQNVEFQIREFQESIDDINTIFKKLGSATDTKSSEINIGMNSQPNDLLASKMGLIANINHLRTRQVEETNVIYEVSRISNIQKRSFLFSLGIPLIFLSIFLLFNWLKRIYKKYQLN